MRTELFRRLVRSLHPKRELANRVDVLDVVRPLAAFGAALPAYTIKTKQLSAREPATLLFHDLPVACELPPFAAPSGAESNADEEQIEVFARSLQASLDELRGVYPALLKWMLTTLQERFGLNGTFAQMQETLGGRAKNLAGVARESRFKSFCLRLADTGLPQNQRWNRWAVWFALNLRRAGATTTPTNMRVKLTRYAVNLRASKRRFWEPPLLASDRARAGRPFAFR